MLVLPVLICVTGVSNEIMVNIRLGRRLNANIHILYLIRIIISEKKIFCIEIPGSDLGYQDSCHMHLPPHPHHDPADHDFSPAGSYPECFLSLTIITGWLRSRKTKHGQIFCYCVRDLLPSPSMSSSHASPRPSESVSLWSGLSTRTQLSHASPWLSLSLFSWFIFGVNQQLS